MATAGEIMKPGVITATRDMAIYDAIRLMVDNQITGLPVVDAEGYPVGILSEKDVLKLVYHAEDMAEGRETVEHFMTQNVVSFNEDDPLDQIGECLMNNPFRRVPILADGKVVGIISRHDLMHYIVTLRRPDELEL